MQFVRKITYNSHRYRKVRVCIASKPMMLGPTVRTWSLRWNLSMKLIKFKLGQTVAILWGLLKKLVGDQKGRGLDAKLMH